MILLKLNILNKNGWLTTKREDRINSMEHSPSWEANSCSASQEIPCLLWNLNGHYCVHKSPSLVSNPSQMNPVHTLRSTLIISHVCLSFPSGLFTWGFRTKIFMHFSSLPCMLHAWLILLYLIILIIIGKEYKLWSTLLCSFLQPPTIFSLLGRNILLSTLFSSTKSMLFPSTTWI